MKEMDLFRVPDEELDQEFLSEEPSDTNEVIEPEEFVDYEEPEEYELESDLVIPGEEEDYIFEKGEKILVYSKKKVEEDKLEERVLKPIEIQEEVVIEQDDKKIILEKGDMIKILKEEDLEGYLDIDIDLTEKELEPFTLQANKFGKFIDKLIISSSSIEPKFNDNELKKNSTLLSLFFDKIVPRLTVGEEKLGRTKYLMLSFYFVTHLRKSGKYDSHFFYVLVGYFDLVKRTWKFSDKDSGL